MVINQDLAKNKTEMSGFKTAKIVFLLIGKI